MAEAFTRVAENLRRELRAEWLARASCRNMGPDIFYSADKYDKALAMKICTSCPVRPECMQLAAALRLGPGGDYFHEGIWGGFHADWYTRDKAERIAREASRAP